MSVPISGFSKLGKAQKIEWLTRSFCADPAAAAALLDSWQHADPAVQKVLDGFTENVVSNFPFPFSIAPNFLINNRLYA
ncbi:MAG TPA: hydroxymethylglutaryl-CoA reductase, partial [Saprospiraceae bacterium]|nr:hydroxymethylglutaryl-CoA reductase [Saprospiraceae bacterium]